MKKAMAWLLVLALVAAVIPFAAPTEVAAAYSSAQVAVLKPTIISNSTYANYVTKMIQYHVGSSTDNYRVYRNLSAGKSAVFLFEGCSDIDGWPEDASGTTVQPTKSSNASRMGSILFIKNILLGWYII